MMSRLINMSVQLFSLDHHDKRAFCTSPVLRNQKVFIIYRVVVACLWGCFNVWSLLDAISRQDWLWFARLTHWTMCLLTAHLIFSAVLAWRHLYCSEHNDELAGSLAKDDSGDNLRQRKTVDDSDGLMWYHKASWVLFNLAGASAFCVTTLYLTMIDTPRYFVGIMEHLINSVIAAVDIVLSGIPVKMSHFVYPDLVGATFAVFTMMYWALGGVGKNGETFLYPFLNYEEEHRARTVRFIVASLVILGPLVQAFCCALCYLRSWVIVKFVPKLRVLP